jgi:hypothetical protein
MINMNEITDALAATYGKGISLDEPKKVVTEVYRSSPMPAPRSYDNGGYQPAATGGPKLFPSDRMALRSFSSSVIAPKRPAVLMSTYSDRDLEWMLGTPSKRGWEFKDWLEVIGLPIDLHEKHDGLMYTYAARAFLDRKAESHRR